MNINGISTLATNLLSQNSISATQTDLAKAQNELSTGRHDDVGLVLGANVSRNLNWRVALSDTTTFLETNAQVLTKADVLQSSFAAVKTAAGSFLDTLAGARLSQNGQALARSGASYAMDAVTAAINVSYAGDFLMGGQNAATPPLASYPASAAQAAFDASFQSYFGFSKSAPAASSITPSQMNGFLQGPFEALFQAPGWNTTFSSASDKGMENTISTNQSVDLSTSANEAPIKDLMRAMVAVQDAGIGQLNASTFQTVVDYALGKVSGAVQGIGESEARVGAAQQVVVQADAKLTSMKSILENEIQKTEGVDGAQAATRVNALMNQLEANYAVTGKLAKLSLLSYL